MVDGSCLCGQFKIQYDGQPAAKAVCHCLPCRKSSGTPRSFNLMVPNNQFKKLSGDSKTWGRLGDSGKSVTYHNCANCCTLMYVETEAMPDIKIVKYGTIDDESVINAGNWNLEIYMKHGVSWLPPVKGVEIKETA